MRNGVYCGPYYNTPKGKSHYKNAHNIYHIHFSFDMSHR